MQYKAVFFDRDNTLTYFNKEKEKWRDITVSGWSGHPLSLPYEKMMKLFGLSSERRTPWYKTLDDERDFFTRYYKYLLIEEGVTENTDGKAELCLTNCGAITTAYYFPKQLKHWNIFALTATKWA